MKHVLIVESPAKIKTIKKFLGKDFMILSTLGHIKDLPKKEIGVELTDAGLNITYVPLENKEKTIAELAKAAGRADNIFLAPDPDREGEIIAWHVAQEIAKTVKDPKKIHRITFNEITKPAIEKAIQNPGEVDSNKVGAQQARRILDRWVGYQVSPILWRKVSKGLSAGRVQSVALKLICNREQEIQSFKPEEYWTIDGLFKHNNETFTASLTHKNKKKIALKNKKETDALLKELPKQEYNITSIKDSQRLKNPLAPFMTSTLQQSAYNRLGFSVQKTMQVAQKLYEGVPLKDASTPVALITYMRTDSLRISDVAIKDVRAVITSNFGKEYLPAKSRAYAKKTKGQDAHEAIRPINSAMTPEQVKPYLEKDLYALYTLIWQRFVACQMKSAEYAQRQVVITGGAYQFKVTGSTLLFDGFLKVYPTQEDKKKVSIPKDIAENNPVALEKTEEKQHFTQPPARYTQATLVKELEKEGIGRPSTYATILRTIQQRAYTELDDKKRFVPTELGSHVTKLLEENLPRIMDTKFTAHLEEDLDKIAQGQLERDKLLREFYGEFEKELEKFAGLEGKQAQETDIVCPECKKNKLLIRFGKMGPFLGCSGFPDCTFTSNFERQEDGSIKLVKKAEPKVLDETCPQCGKPLQQRVGRYGPFIACTGYPECKYIKQEESKFPCPQCGQKLIKRSWKGKTFWGCKGYPKCRFSISGDIIQQPCPKCKKPYLLKRVSAQGAVGICPDKECGYQTVIEE